MLGIPYLRKPPFTNMYKKWGIENQGRRILPVLFWHWIGLVPGEDVSEEPGFLGKNSQISGGPNATKQLPFGSFGDGLIVEMDRNGTIPGLVCKREFTTAEIWGCKDRGSYVNSSDDSSASEQHIRQN